MIIACAELERVENSLSNTAGNIKISAKKSADGPNPRFACAILGFAAQTKDMRFAQQNPWMDQIRTLHPTHIYIYTNIYFSASLF